MPIIYGQYDTGEQLNAPGQMAGYRTAAQVFGEGAESGFWGGGLGLIAKTTQNLDAKMEGQPITEQEWKDSQYYRPGVNFQKGWTTARAELEAERWDNKQATAYHSAQHPIASIAGNVTETVGELAALGAVPGVAELEPVDTALEAFKGTRVADGIANALKMTRAARFVNGAVVGAGAESSFQAANLAYQASEGQTPDWRDALIQTGEVAALGGLGYAVGSFVKKAGIVNKAIDDLERDRPVQAEPVGDSGDFTVSSPNLQAHAVSEAPTWTRKDIGGEMQYVSSDGDIAPTEATSRMEDADNEAKLHIMALRIGANCLGIG